MHTLALDVLKRDEKHQWNLLLSPHRLRVQTIDGFCQSLVQQLPLSAGNNTLLNSTEAPQSLYEEAVLELLAELNREDGVRDDLSRLLLHLDTNVAKLQQLLVQLLQNRGQWMKPLLQARGHTIDSELAKQHLENSLQTIIDESLQRLRAALEPHWNSLLEIVSFAATNLNRENASEPEASVVGPTQVLASIGGNILDYHQTVNDLEECFYPTHDKVLN
jgi:ATP-dependent exoDNAse (exonuclease V) beta subunit